MKTDEEIAKEEKERLDKLEVKSSHDSRSPSTSNISGDMTPS